MENGKAIQEAENEEPDVETLPEASGVVGGALGIEDQLALAENIGKLVEAQTKIRMTLLKLAQSGDWVTFGDGDKEKAELNFAGSMRIGSVLGVSFTNWAAEKENGTDEKGSWYRWNYECDAVFKGRVVRVYGRASSRDKFFGKVRGEYKALHDVDEGNIRMAARRGAMKEGVKVLFGFHHMDPVELKKFGVPLERASGHKFQGAADKAEETGTAKGVTITNGSLKKGDNWTLYKVDASDGKTYSTFSKTDYEVAKLAKESNGKVDISFKQGKYGPEITGIVMAQ